MSSSLHLCKGKCVWPSAKSPHASVRKGGLLAQGMKPGWELPVSWGEGLL